MGQVVHARHADANLEAVLVERLHEGQVAGPVRMYSALTVRLGDRATVQGWRALVGVRLFGRICGRPCLTHRLTARARRRKGPTEADVLLRDGSRHRPR